MSIYISYEAVTNNKEIFGQALHQICNKIEAEWSENEDYYGIHVCPLGDIFFQFEKEDGDNQRWHVSGECQTNLIGPGFHKCVVDILDELQEKIGIVFQVSDETNYYEDRDFKRMKSENFYGWLKSLITVLDDKYKSGEYVALCVCWDIDNYQPEEIAGTIVTPFGRYDIISLNTQVKSKGIEEFAREFFIWNDISKDSRYYRNCGLKLMWEDCYFMQGDRSDEDNRINSKIISYLERAAVMDKSLPFPREDYILLCDLNDKKPMDITQYPNYKSEYPIGYRKDWIRITMGKLSIAMPGNFLYEYGDDGDNLWYDNNEKGWKNIRITGFSRKSGNAEFRDQDWEKLQGKFVELVCGDGTLRYHFQGQMEENGDTYYFASGEAICDNSLYLISVCYENEKDSIWAKEFFERLRCRSNQ